MQDVTRGSISWKTWWNQTHGDKFWPWPHFLHALIFVVPPPVWPEGGKPCPFQRCDLFLYSARWARTRCWGPWSPPQTGPPRAGPPSVPASRDTAHGCCLNEQRGAVDDITFYHLWCFFLNLHTFKFNQLLVVLPAQRNLLPVLLQKIFVGLRHLSDGCWNLPKTKKGQKTVKKKKNPRFVCYKNQTRSWCDVAVRTCFFASLIAAP